MGWTFHTLSEIQPIEMNPETSPSHSRETLHVQTQLTAATSIKHKKENSIVNNKHSKKQKNDLENNTSAKQCPTYHEKPKNDLENNTSAKQCPTFHDQVHISVQNYSPHESELFQRCRKLCIPFQPPPSHETKYEMTLRTKKIKRKIAHTEIKFHTSADDLQPPPPLSEDTHFNKVMDCMRAFEIQQMLYDFKYVLKRVSLGSKDCTIELKLECAYLLGQTSQPLSFRLHQ